MANKRLSIPEIEQMKKMVQSGNAPEDIAKHFNVAISSVHNYKARFKADGMKFPSVRGKRPTGSVAAESVRNPIVQASTAIKQIGDSYQFVVNGVKVQVSGNAKNVNIGKNSMEINY
jgi:transposase